MNIGTKQLIIAKLEKFIFANKNFKILDLGSGQSKNFLPLLKKYPDIFYVGVEPNKKEADTARELLKSFPNVKIYNKSACEEISGAGEFDVCISLSVLEHVKPLKRFLENSVRIVKAGGQIIHLYDLGHSLYPNSLKEKIQIFLGNNFPKFLPENKFVSYLDEEKVKKIIKEAGAEIKEVTYHQMPNHKKLFSLISGGSLELDSLSRGIFEWEFKISKFLSNINKKQREELFPSVCVWATKNY